MGTRVDKPLRVIAIDPKYAGEEVSEEINAEAEARLQYRILIWVFPVTNVKRYWLHGVSFIFHVRGVIMIKLVWIYDGARGISSVIGMAVLL
jgi:hypothetical protein